MQKQLLSFSILALAFTFMVVTGCNNDDPDNPKTKTELLTTGTWKFSTATSGGSDVSPFIQACLKDNIYTFFAAGTGTMDEGASKCNAGDPQQSPYTWNFISNETMIHVSSILFPGGTNDFTLVSLTETQLVVSQTINIGTPQNVVVTFIH
jgi:hypothetical protein